MGVQNHKMCGVSCMLCKSTIDDRKKYNIDEDHTIYSKFLLRMLIENTVRKKLLVNTNFDICSNCFRLLNELDRAEMKYKNIRRQVLDYLGCSIICETASAFCQTDAYLGSVNEDLKNDIKIDVNHDTSNNRELQEDEHKLNDVKPYECYVCSKKFNSKNGLKFHLKKQHPAIINFADDNQCIEPKEEIEYKPDVNNISVGITDLALNDFKYLSNKDLGDVVNTENNKDFVEDEEKPKRRRGRKKKNPDVPKPYKCPECPKTWKTSSELKSHLSAHSDARPFICEICGQAYKHKTALDVHVGMHNGINPFTCSYCNKTFTQKGALQRHLPIHTGEAPFQCDLCGKRFVHHTSFNIHQLSHSGQKAYKCDTCGLALVSGSHLKRHMRVHTGERNFVCSTCGRRFAERYNLVSHQKLHEKNGCSKSLKRCHRCNICGNTYERRLKLDEHLTNDHKETNNSDIPKAQQLTSKRESWITINQNIKAEVLHQF